MIKRKYLLQFTVVFLLVSFSQSNSFAASANGNGTATVVSPIAITANQDLAFGKIDGSGALGTVIMSTAGVRSKTGGVVLVSTGSTQNQATFDVTGAANSTYAITLPVAAVNITDGGVNSMTIDTFTSNPNGTGTLSAGGTQTINVGGTLHVGAAQAPGSYTGVFVVSVDYN